MWALVVSVPDHCLSFYFKTPALKIMLLIMLFDSIMFP